MKNLNIYILMVVYFFLEVLLKENLILSVLLFFLILVGINDVLLIYVFYIIFSFSIFKISCKKLF